MKVVEVTWIDAASDESELRVEEMSKPPRVRTVGVLVQEFPTYISVAAEELSHDSAPKTYRSVTYIPRGMIVPRGIRVLER